MLTKGPTGTGTGGDGSHRYLFLSVAQKRTTGGGYRWGGTGREVPVGSTGRKYRWGRVTPVGEHMKTTIYLRKIRYRWDLSSSPTGGEKEPAILYFSLNLLRSCEHMNPASINKVCVFFIFVTDRFFFIVHVHV